MDSGPGSVDPRAAVEAPPPQSQEEMLRARGFEIMRTWKPQGLLRRLLITYRHFLGLLFGGLAALLATRREEGAPRNVRYLLLWFAALPGRIFVDRALRREPFPVQLRRRLERLGPTYIKLGQILSLREDLLPKPITDELKHLLNRLPVVPLSVLEAIIEKDLKRPIDQLFLSINPIPLGSASIGQTHLATTVKGERVIVKVVKPGIRQTLERDARLLRMLGALAPLPAPAGGERVLHLHPAGGGPAPGGGERRDLRGPLRRRARRPLPANLQGL